jgi:TonB family protein
VGFSRILPISCLLCLCSFPADTKAAGYEPKKAMKATASDAGVEILSDTGGVDFGPYVKNLVQAVRKSWLPIIPVSARPPQNKQGRVGIRFKIDPTGHISGMLLESPSGDISLDRAAWGGITDASPYPPLPTEFTGPFLELRLGFYYNVDPNKPPHVK